MSTGAAPRFLTYSEARERLLAAAKPVATETIALSEGAGRILAESITGSHPLPPFDNSAMDGLAVRASNLAGATQENPVELRVAGFLAAGDPPTASLHDGQALRIMTGAPVPDGADSVVPFEEVVVSADVARFSGPVRAGANVRRAGADLAAGEAALSPGRSLSAWDLAVLASLGVARVPVFRRPRVAVLSTGDELIPVDAPLRPGAIRDSNLLLLSALVREVGAEVSFSGHCPDRSEEVTRAIGRAHQGADALLTIGGVSEGDRDPVRDSLRDLSGLELWRVAMKPGRPQASGMLERCLFHGLPGNPASVAVVFDTLVRPALLKMAGCRELERPRLRARCVEEVESKSGRTDFLRVLLEPEPAGWGARPAGSQISGHVLPQSRAHGLMIVPEAVPRLRAGDEVDVILWRHPVVVRAR